MIYTNNIQKYRTTLLAKLNSTMCSVTYFSPAQLQKRGLLSISKQNPLFHYINFRILSCLWYQRHPRERDADWIVEGNSSPLLCTPD